MKVIASEVISSLIKKNITFKGSSATESCVLKLQEKAAPVPVPQVKMILYLHRG